MKGTFYIILCAMCCVAISSCDNNDMEPMGGPKYSDIDVVTGIDLTDDNGQAIGRWREPNHNPGALAIYPNPNLGTVFLYSTDTLVRVWLVPAQCLHDTITQNIPELSKQLSYSISELQETNIQDVPLEDFNQQVVFNFTEVDPGLYRLFYQLSSGEIFWDNLYMDPSVTTIPSFDVLDALCE